MSDMIDRLSELANEAGADASERLATSGVAVQLRSRIRDGARRRRITALAVTGAAALVVAGGVVVAPRLFDAPPLPPAGDTRVPVDTTDGLISFDDGSMQVLTHDGEIVEVPPPAADAPFFAPVTSSEGCAAFAPPAPGWTVDFPEAFRLLSFGRPLVLDATGYHVLTQGQRVAVGANYDQAAFAFSVDVDPSIAPNVVMTATSYTLAPDGAVAYFQSQLESRPAVEYAGDREVGTYTATLTTRLLTGGTVCDEAYGRAKPAAASGLLKYLVVNVFLNDGHGHLAPIATHTSWITVAKEDA